MFGNTVDQRKCSLVTLHSYIQFHSSRGHKTEAHAAAAKLQPAFTPAAERNLYQEFSNHILIVLSS